MNETRATRHQRLRRRARIASAATGGAVLAGVALTPASRRLAVWAAGGADPGPAAVAAFVLVIVALLEIAALPGLWYFEYRGAGRARAARVPAREVIGAQAQAALVATVGALAAAGVWLAAVAVAGPWWWVAASGLVAAMLLAGLRGVPALFSRLAVARPLTRPGLAERLDALGSRARVRVGSVHEWRLAPGAGPTALVTGFGRTRRVFIATSLLTDWSDDEIAVVVAHELGHHRHHDLWVTLALDGGIAGAALFLADAVLRRLPGGFGFAGPGDLAALPCLALVAAGVWLAATPIRHAVSRRQERRADMFALAVTGGAEAFSAAVRRLGEQHLAEERPSRLARWWFARHPPVAERVALAEAYRRLRAISPSSR